MKNYDVCIIGGGASGLAAAASLDDGINACLLEKTAHPARKYPLQEAEGAILPTERHREQKRQLSFLEVLASNCTVMKKAGIIRIPIRHLM